MRYRFQKFWVWRKINGNLALTKIKQFGHGYCTGKNLDIWIGLQLIYIASEKL